LALKSAVHLEQLLSDKDYGLRMRFERGEVAAFFKPGPDHDAVLAERRMWISSDPERHVAILPDGTIDTAATAKLRN
jgi:hypothetical protein